MALANYLTQPLTLHNMRADDCPVQVGMHIRAVDGKHNTPERMKQDRPKRRQAFHYN